MRVIILLLNAIKWPQIFSLFLNKVVGAFPEANYWPHQVASLLHCAPCTYHGPKQMSDTATPISGLNLNDIDSVRWVLDDLSKKGSDSPFIPLFEARLLLEVGEFTEAGERFLAVVKNNELNDRVFQLSLRLIGLITDDQNFLNILLKIRKHLADQIFKQEQTQTISQSLDALGYVKQNTTKRLRLLSEHFVSVLANRAYDLLRVDTAFFFEQKIYQTLITECETEEAFNFGMELTRDSAIQAGERVKDKLGDKNFEYSNSKPIIGFFFHNASMLAHISNVHGYLSSAYEKGYPDFVPILFCLGGRDEEFEEAYSKIDVKVIYLDIDLNDSTKKIHSVATRLIQLRTICEQLKVDKIVWGCLASFMPFAFNMRLAKEQIWWSQKWQNFNFNGLDKRIYSFNKDFIREQFGQTWFGGWFQRNSWLGKVGNNDVKRIRDEFAGKIILGSLCRTEKISNLEYLNTISGILRRHENVVYLWAGRQQDATIYDHFVQEGVEGKTRFIGWVDTSIYASAFDIFLDSFPAGSGITALQAMEAGTPVVMRQCDLTNSKSLEMLFRSLMISEQTPDSKSRTDCHLAETSQADVMVIARNSVDFVNEVDQLIRDHPYRISFGKSCQAFIKDKLCSPSASEIRFTKCLLAQV